MKKIEAGAINNKKLISEKYFIAIIFLALLFSLFAAVYGVIPPHVKHEPYPPTDFSAERAFDNLRFIAKDPHFSGTPANKEVMEYIIDTLKDLGLEPYVQKRYFAGVKYWGNVTIHNVICRIKGKTSKSTIMLAAHYDSMPTTPGAMDDGSGTAVLLETARAILSGPPLKNDIILLFSDGEEPGLLGAQSFAEDSKPLLDEVSLIANFDAGGTDGPAALVETSSCNSKIIKHLLKKTSVHTAFSSLVDLTKFFPSSTDVRVLGTAGTDYINIVVSMHKERIHTAKDNIADFSIGTMQQQGNYAVAFCKVFGNIDDLPSAISSGTDSVFFPVSKWFTVIYDENWAFILAFMTTLVYIAIMCVGVRTKALSLKNILYSLLAFLFGIACSVTLSFLIISLARIIFQSRINPFFGFQLFMKGSEFTNVLMIGLVFISFSIISLILHKVLRKRPFIDMFSGVLLIWCIAVLVTGLYLKGLSYMFVWPFILALIIQGYIICLRKSFTGKLTLTAFAFSTIVPSFILFFPVAYIASSEGIDKMPLIIILISLPFGLIIPYLNNILQKKSSLIHAFTGALGIVLSLFGIIGFGLWIKFL